MTEWLSTFRDMLEDSGTIVFFGGAGVSTASGIPDFRSSDGLFRKEFPWPAEEILSHTFFFSRTEDFYRFYRQQMVYPEAKPNYAHRWLADMEQKGKLTAVVTQNIDGLHQEAGSVNVFELHGSIHRNRCLSCGKRYALSDIVKSETIIPRCDCGGVIKPDVVLYEEGLDDQTVTGAVDAIRQADMLIVAGTSLRVYPAAGLLRYFRGKYLILVNRDATELDSRCNLVIHGNIADVFEAVANQE